MTSSSTTPASKLLDDDIPIYSKFRRLQDGAKTAVGRQMVRVLHDRATAGARATRGVRERPGSVRSHLNSFPCSVTEELRHYGELRSVTDYRSSYLHHGAVSTISVAFSTDGVALASTHGDHTVKITCCNSGRLLKNLVGHPRTPWTVKFHPTRHNIVASGCLGFQVRVWDWKRPGEGADSCCLHMVRLHYAIISLAFHPSGGLLGVASGNSLYLWDYEQVERRTLLDVRHEHTLRCVHFPPGGNTIIVGGVDPSDGTTNGPNSTSLSFSLNLFDFDIRAITRRRMDERERLRRDDRSRINEALKNKRLLVSRALLYNDGGFDVSPCGTYLCACAEYWLPHGIECVTELSPKTSCNLQQTPRQPGTKKDRNSTSNDDDMDIDIGNNEIGAKPTISRSRQPPTGITQSDVENEKSNTDTVHAKKSSFEPRNQSKTPAVDGNTNTASLPHNSSTATTYRVRKIETSSTTRVLNYNNSQRISTRSHNRLRSSSSDSGASRTASSRSGSTNSTNERTTRTTAFLPLSQYPLTPPSHNRRTIPLSPPSPPGRRHVGGLSSSTSTTNKHRPQQQPYRSNGMNRSSMPVPPPPPPPNVSPVVKGRYVPHVVLISLIENNDKNNDNNHGERSSHDPLEAAPLDESKASGVTCVKFSPSAQFCLLGYGVRENLSRQDANSDDDDSQYHPVTALYRIHGGMTHVSTMMSSDDDVNIARFHPHSGHGFVYGTKQGRVRILSPKPWNDWNPISPG